MADMDGVAPDPAAALQVALAAATEAGCVLVAMRGEAARMQATSKSSLRDLVTAADLAAEEAIVMRLRAAFADHAIEAEESMRDALDERPRWFVDPLDGTVNYVHGLPAYCVSLALWHRGAPLVAVVHAPALRERFWAARGHGAWVEQLDAAGAPCSAPARGEQPPLLRRLSRLCSVDYISTICTIAEVEMISGSFIHTYTYSRYGRAVKALVSGHRLRACLLT